MKKIFFSIAATVIMSTFSASAGGGKKLHVKKVARIECSKKCPNTTNCHKGNCPEKPGCMCK